MGAGERCAVPPNQRKRPQTPQAEAETGSAARSILLMNSHDKLQNREKHKAWVDSMGEHACDIALLQLVNEYGDIGDDSTSTQVHNQIIGAKRFIRILLSIHIPPTPPEPPRHRELKPV